MGNKVNVEQSVLLSNQNFQEIETKIMRKLNFWKGAGLSLKGRIRVVNMFIFSKLLYRLECVDISKEMVSKVDKTIKSYIWKGKIAGRVDSKVLTSSYEQGGLQLYNLDVRIRVLRVKWLTELSTSSSAEIGRYLADTLIGSYRGIKGLKILNHDIDLKKFERMDEFYQNAIKMWRAMKIQFQGANIIEIKNEVIFNHTLLLKRDGSSFKFFNPTLRRNYIPHHFKDLPITQTILSIQSNHRDKIREINGAFWTMREQKLGKYNENCYTISVNGEQQIITKLSFKDIYKVEIDKVDVERIWEQKWNRLLRYYTLDIDENEWIKIWKSVHDNIHLYEIQSSIWTMIHLNFYCGYKEKVFKYGEGKCKLCGEIEEGSHHIITECFVTKSCFTDLLNILKYLDVDYITKDEMAFGLYDSNQNVGNIRLRNYFTFTLRHTIFKNRHNDFGGKDNAKLILKQIAISKIKEEIIDNWKIRCQYGRESELIKQFFKDNILGNIQNNEIIFNF